MVLIYFLLGLIHKHMFNLVHKWTKRVNAWCYLLHGPDMITEGHKTLRAVYSLD